MPEPILTRRDDIVDELHGVQVPDPYRWLEDVTAPDVRAWMKAQDDVARAYLRALPRRRAIATRLKELSYYDALGAPRHRNGRYFWTRKHQDKEKLVVYWRQGENGEPNVLFDPNLWSEDGSTALGMWQPSWDGRYAAYNINANNSDEAVLHVVEVATGKRMPDVIAGTKYASVSWTPDSEAFYYTWVPPISDQVTVADRPGHAELRLHRLGTDPSTDPVIHAATGDPRTFLGGGISRDGHWLIASISHGWTSTDVYLKDTRLPDAPWRPIVEGTDATYGVWAWRDQLYVQTNEGAPRYRLFQVDPRRLDRADWEEIVPESDATLDTADILGGHLVLSYLRNATSELEVRRLDGSLVRKVVLPGLGSTTGVVGLPDEDIAYIGYSSFTEPSVILRTSIANGGVTEWARVSLPFDPKRMVTEQVRYPSKDGTSISMFLVRRKDAVADGRNPTILYGYGGFNVSMTPGFAQTWAVWLELGGMVAIPNLRGGGEYGEDWHRAGMLLDKQNVFDDFVGAARYLIDQKWTSPDKLAIRGGSNGGLLVGAAMVQAPELFHAVVCAVPLLDMVRYHLSGSGKTWISEYGSADDPAHFKAIHAYSPYQNVAAGVPYPSMLMLSADSDDRVDPLHARKFTAAIQHATSSPRPVLLRVEHNAGHGGADLVKQRVEELADTLAFLVDQLGV